MKLLLNSIAMLILTMGTPANAGSIPEFESAWGDVSDAEIAVSDCLVQCVAQRNACMGERPRPLGNIASLERRLQSYSSCLMAYFNCNRQCNAAGFDAIRKLQ